MKKLNKVLCAIVVMAIMIGMNTVVNAASFQTKLVADQTNLLPGQEVTIGVSLSDIDAGTTGISGFQATLEYDTNIFETVVATNFSAQNNWDGITYNPANGSLTTVKQTFVKTAEEIMTIKLKVKSGAVAGKAVVTFKDITSSTQGTDDFVDVKANNVSLNLNIMSSSDNTNTINNTITNITTNNTVANIITNTNTISKNNIIINNTSKNDVSVNAGLEDYTVPFIFMGIIIAGVAYINYRKYKDIK